MSGCQKYEQQFVLIFKNQVHEKVRLFILYINYVNFIVSDMSEYKQKKKIQ